MNVLHIGALLCDAPCKSQYQQPANTVYSDCRDLFYNLNVTRIFRPLMEHEEYYVSIFIWYSCYYIKAVIKL